MSVPQTVPRRLLAAHFEISEEHLRGAQIDRHTLDEDENAANAGCRLHECGTDSQRNDRDSADFYAEADISLERSRSLSCSSVGSCDSVETISTCSTTRRAQMNHSFDPQTIFATQLVEPTEALVEPLEGLDQGPCTMTCANAYDTQTFEHGEKWLTTCAALVEEATECSTLTSCNLQSPAQPDTPACVSSYSSQCRVPDSSDASDLDTIETKVGGSEAGESEGTETLISDLEELECPHEYESLGTAVGACRSSMRHATYVDLGTTTLTDCSKDSKRRARGQTTYLGKALKIVGLGTSFEFARGLQRK